MNSTELIHPALHNQLWQGDCRALLGQLPDESVDLIMTSPPYADNRKSSYGGIAPDDYVAWFLPIGKQLQRVLKRDGTFILNIKEKVVAGERHPYVLELILALRARLAVDGRIYLAQEKLRARQMAQPLPRFMGALSAIQSAKAIQDESRRRDGANRRLGEIAPEKFIGDR